MKACAGCLLYWVMIGFGIVAFAFLRQGFFVDGSVVSMVIGIAATIATAGVYWLIDRGGLLD